MSASDGSRTLHDLVGPSDSGWPLPASVFAAVERHAFSEVRLHAGADDSASSHLRSPKGSGYVAACVH